MEAKSKDSFFQVIFQNRGGEMLEDSLGEEEWSDKERIFKEKTGCVYRHLGRN